MTSPTHKAPFLIGKIADVLRWFELLIFTISAPVLSAATVIAVVDLLTGGRLLATQPKLVFAFGVALAIGIDSQLPAACERVRDAWEATPKRWLTLLLWAVIAAWTGMVIYTALRAFSIEQAQHVDETTALALIGIDPALFAAQRDLLAVVLLGLSGFARVKARAYTRSEERAELEKEIELEPLRQQVEQLKARRVVNVVAAGRAAVDAFTSTPETPLAPVASPEPNLSEQTADTSSRSSVTLQPPLERPSADAGEAVTAADMERIRERKREWDAIHGTAPDDAPEPPPTGPGSPATSKRGKAQGQRAKRAPVIRLQAPKKERAAGRKTAARGSAESRVRALLDADPSIGFDELVKRAGVSESTASKHLRVWQAEHGQVAQ